MDRTTVLQTIAIPAFYTVACASCGEPLIAPDTRIDRYAWTPQEAFARPIVRCAKCGIAQQPTIATDGRAA